MAIYSSTNFIPKSANSSSFSLKSTRPSSEGAVVVADVVVAPVTPRTLAVALGFEDPVTLVAVDSGLCFDSLCRDQEGDGVLDSLPSNDAEMPDVIPTTGTWLVTDRRCGTRAESSQKCILPSRPALIMLLDSGKYLR